MIKYLEKHNKLSWLITLTIAITIFYISSQTFPQGTPGPEFSLKPYIYHLLVFATLNLLLLISITKGKNKSLILTATTIAILYAISDEIHQLFVPGRHGSISDVLIDTTGIFIATILYLPKFRKN